MVKKVLRSADEFAEQFLLSQLPLYPSPKNDRFLYLLRAGIFRRAPNHKNSRRFFLLEKLRNLGFQGLPKRGDL